MYTLPRFSFDFLRYVRRKKENTEIGEIYKGMLQFFKVSIYVTKLQQYIFFHLLPNKYFDNFIHTRRKH